MESKRSRLRTLVSQLENERASFLSHWKDLGEYILPRRPRWTATDVNKGDRRSQRIIDSTATMAARTLRSGMMSGVTSPARPWFKLTTPDPGSSEAGAVKAWLHTVTQRMSTVFLRSNLYNALPIIYGDTGVFGTSAMSVEEAFDGTVVRFHPFPIGSYCLANDERMKVSVFTRTFRMTVRQIVGKFCEKRPDGTYDLSVLSTGTLAKWKAGQTEDWIDVTHVIQPNEESDGKKPAAKYKKYYSCYFEAGGDEDKFLRESGHDFFPILAPRWEVNAEDTYGTDCPGMVALGDIRQMQLGEKRIMQAIEKQINPPMVASTALKREKTSILPGDITYAQENGGIAFRPAHEVQSRIDQLEMKQQQVRLRVQRAFYEDLFLMLAESDRRQITAREIEERHEEKLLALGPVLEQLNQDLLDPLIDITFDIMVRQGLIPPAPEEMRGMPLRVEYISILAQAQKLIGLSGVDRFTQFAIGLAPVAPGALDKVDTDHLLDVVADLTSIPPGIVRADEDVTAMRSAAAQQAQAQQQAEQMQAMAGTAQKLSQTPTTGDNALAAMLQQAQAGQLAPQ